MDAGGVQVQHQPSNQSWRNGGGVNGNDQNKRNNGSNGGNNKTRPANLKSINVEHAQSILGTSSRSSPPQNVFISRSPPKSVSPSSSSNGSLNGNNNNSNAINAASTAVQLSPSKQKSSMSNSAGRPTPKPLNLSKSTAVQVSNFNRGPQTATFAPKVSRALNLPQPPKTATFSKSTGFPKELRQATAVRMPQAYAFLYGDQTYIQAVPESPRLRRYSATPAPLRFVTSNYRQVELGPGTPVVVLSHPEDSDSQESSPPTPGYLPEGYGPDIYDFYQLTYEPEEIEDNHLYYYYPEYQQDYVPQTPTGTSQPRTYTLPTTSKDQRRRSVIGGPMKVHPDAVLPIRQPKGPDMAKNFATRIRRKAVNKLYAAAAERRRLGLF
ncbi:7368_t:CDS:2 [Ambispora leptoticha]|uniref:7368_t:CDS:1 n=1 Tax=Ambispora leptoticha TaxID=144679 RepID=A0A9N8VH09_9GLOM|nr:7368_t:CDS:2 [Ambispora leptoticha]